MNAKELWSLRELHIRIKETSGLLRWSGLAEFWDLNGDGLTGTDRAINGIQIVNDEWLIRVVGFVYSSGSGFIEGHDYYVKGEFTEVTLQGLTEIVFCISYISAWNSYLQEANPTKESNSTERLGLLKRSAKNILDNPKSIYNYLDSCVYGHKEYKKALALFVWQIRHGHRPSPLLIAGNSGEGKTETIRALQKVYRNIAVTDGAVITPQGYRGNNKLASAMNLLDMNDPAYPPIYVIDEADKLICRQGWGDADLTGELLKLMEDGVLDISENNREQKIVNTENVGFILLGSFSHLTDRVGSKPVGFNEFIRSVATTKRKPLTVEMVRDTLSPELQGRIGDIIILEPFEQADFEHILEDERYSPIQRFEKEYHLRINLKPGKRERIAASAYINQTGVRSMTTEIERCLKDYLFENPETRRICI